MDTSLSEVFDQARQLVAGTYRFEAETERQLREIEDQAKLAELAKRAEEAFDFTSREKLELDTRMDVHEDVAVIEFVVRAAHAVFLLIPKDDVLWDLLVIEDGKHVSNVAEIVGGIKAEPNSPRRAAARVVAAISFWVEKNRQHRVAASSQVLEQILSRNTGWAKARQPQGQASFPAQPEIIDVPQTPGSLSVV